ncbi:MAG: chromosomal replication initiator protein DnaA [Bacteroidetes bacterium]|nr:chromosomal replication initiator protein DnaA [Bacteroidota bacterium]MBU1720732.1 chromosomal replication initiator protein DnaA [Bacteroidota bacterium]
MQKDHIQVWENCLKIIRDNTNAQSFRTWFDPIVPVRLENSVLTIQVPSQFFYEWLEEHYIDLLKKTIKKELGHDGQLEYSIIIDNTFDEKRPPITVRVPTSNRKEIANPSVTMPIDINKGNPIRNPFVIPGLKKIVVQSQLQPSKSFENFIEGDCNRLARSAGFAVANNPGGTSFNPLFIYSDVGLGKTHLAHAIGIQIKNNFPNKTVLYVSAEKFGSQFVEAVKSNNTNDFVHFYQMIDVLIIDDVQFFSGKEKTQDVFFHIFNHLHQTARQIVLTSDRPPVEMQGIEHRLLSRFKWGLSADLQAPDFETRVAILEKKIYSDGIEIPKEVVEYLAYSITNNIRELEGALISLLAQSSLNRKSINLELAKQMIDVFVKNSAREVSIDYIQKVVCDYFSIALDIINSKTRKREVVQARQIAMFFAKSMTKSSLATIGLHCGNKDHATVLHACRTVNNLMETDKSFKNYIDDIEKRIKM